MELVIWHGYLLEGTGSNIYTRQVARAWAARGHRVRVLCQDPHPPALGEQVEVLRPDAGPLLPVFVVDRYPGIEARQIGSLAADELDRYTRANAAALAGALAERPAAFMLANHAVMGGPVAAAGCRDAGTPFGVKVHGSELEYGIRGRPALAALARESLAGAAAVYVGSAHIERVTRELLGAGAYARRIAHVPPGVDVHGFRPERGSREALLELLARPPAVGPAERGADPDAAERLAAVEGPFVVYVGKLIPEKGVALLLDAWKELAPRHPETTLVVVGFGPERAALEARAGPRVVFTGAMDHEQLQRLLPLAEAAVVPSVLAEAFGMIAAEAASCGVVPVVADHSGLAEVADGLGQGCRRFDGTVEGLVAELDGLLALRQDERRALGRAARAAVVERWSWERVAARLLEAAGVAG